MTENKLYKDNQSLFHYIPNFINKDEELDLFNYLQKTDDFIATAQYPSTIYRYQKWYQTEQKYFCPIWNKRFPHWQSFKIDDKITNIINRLQLFIDSYHDISKPKINSCLINKYPDGNHFIGPHRDSVLSFGETPTIINLSLGATRTLLFENPIENAIENKNNFSFELESGSLFIMAGESQNNYLHSIKKSDCKNTRYSLTFREFIL